MSVDGWDDADRADAALLQLLASVHAAPDPHTDELTPSQLRTVLALSHGLNERETAELYRLSVHTAREYALTARRSLAAKTNAHLVAKALRLGLIA